MQIVIGAVPYTVEESDFSESTCGDINTMKCRIRINATMAPAMKRVTLWHEIVHGILYGAGITDHDETTVDAVANGLIQVLRDNPQLTGG